MLPIGDTLRRERVRRNLELPQIAQELKIAVRLLQAIEDDQYDQLPATVFAKNFIRQYAALLGLDGEEMAAQAQHLLDARNKPAEPQPDQKPDVPEMPIENTHQWDSIGPGPSSSSSWITAAALFVAAMLVCSAAYWWLQRSHQTTPSTAVKQAPPATAPPQTAAPSPGGMTPSAEMAAAPPAATSTTATATSGEPVPLSQTPPAESAAAKPPAAANAPANPPGAATAAAANPAGETNPNASVRVEITALDAVWIRARSNGKYVFSGTMQPHQVRNVDTDGTVELLLGNAGGASITLNGRPLSLEGFPSGTIGPKGQVRLVQLTSGGFQIVPSKPPEEPEPRER